MVECNDGTCFFDPIGDGQGEGDGRLGMDTSSIIGYIQ